jgi:hypothetical protein
MQLQTVINNSSRANLLLVHQAITTHYRGLTPAEREKGIRCLSPGEPHADDLMPLILPKGNINSDEEENRWTE